MIGITLNICSSSSFHPCFLKVLFRSEELFYWLLCNELSLTAPSKSKGAPSLCSDFAGMMLFLWKWSLIMIDGFGVNKTQGFCLNFQLHVTKFDKPNDLSIWVLHLSLLGKQLRSLTADTRVMQILADVERQIKEWKWQLLLSPWFWDQYKDLFYNQGKPNLSSSEGQYNSEEQDGGWGRSGIVGNVELGSLKWQRFGDSGLLSLSLVCCKGRVFPPKYSRHLSGRWNCSAPLKMSGNCCLAFSAQCVAGM